MIHRFVSSRLIGVCLALGIVLPALSVVSLTAAEEAPVPASKRIVVLISVDGLAHYYFDDANAEMPNIRRLAQEGARAEKMKAVTPTVTWPNHTTIVTGVTPAKHGVAGNTYLDREKNEVVALIWDPTLDKEQIIKVPTIYDVAKAAGLKTAAVTWPGSRSAKSLDWTVPCMTNSEQFVKYSTPSLIEEFKQAGIPYENETEGFKEGQGENRDRLHTRMFNHIVKTHRPNLALMHILEVDHVEHAHGPQSPEAYAAIKFADGLVGEIVAETEKQFAGKATVIIVSDHGFFPYRQMVHPNRVLRQAGLLTAIGSKITGGSVRAVSQGGCSMLYITDSANREALMKKVPELFKNIDGVALVVGSPDFPQYGLGDPAVMPQSPDIILSAKNGYTFNDTAAGDEIISAPTETAKGSHGYDANEPMLHASFIAWGYGIKPGSNAGTIPNTNVAPTIAKLLGLTMEHVDGAAIQSVLSLKD